MRFGGRALPLPLRVARMLVYLQSGLLVLTGLFVLAVTGLAGAGSGLAPTGPLAGSHRLITGSTTVAVAAFQAAMALVLVLLTLEAGRNKNAARLGLAAAEVVVAVYLVGFLSSDLGSWVFGPILGAAVIACYYWTSAGAGDTVATATAPAKATSEGPVAPPADTHGASSTALPDPAGG